MSTKLSFSTSITPVASSTKYTQPVFPRFFTLVFTTHLSGGISAGEPPLYRVSLPLLERESDLLL